MRYANGIFAIFFLVMGCANAALWPRSYSHYDHIDYRHGYGPTRFFDSVYLSLTVASDSGRWLLVREVVDPYYYGPDLGLTGVWDEEYWHPAAPWSYGEWGGVINPGTRYGWSIDEELIQIRSLLGCDWERQDGAHTSEDTVQTDYHRTQVAIPHSYATGLWFLLGLVMTRRWLRQRAAWGRCVKGCCVKCGYDLRAHAEGQRCPECGTVIQRRIGHAHG